LPNRFCGKGLPEWITPLQAEDLNHMRGYSYAHLFMFCEEFILRQTLLSANKYVHKDSSAFSALLRFTEEETKHQRMFMLIKDRLRGGLGFHPKEVPNKEEVAAQICKNSSFAIYLLTLTLELLTQRHFIECFSNEEKALDPGFVKIFRLHWVEEVQHTRIDILELNSLSSEMTDTEICQSIDEFAIMLIYLKTQISIQNNLDVQNFETMLGCVFTTEQRQELLLVLEVDFLWVFILSGLEHDSFRLVYKNLVPSEALQIEQLLDILSSQTVGSFGTH
jgi:hypothetical protein